MESNLNSPYTKRYVMEDSVFKVTSDGEPHKMLTLIAGVSGMLMAVVILGVLVILVRLRNKERINPPSSISSSPRTSDIPGLSSKRSSILPLFSKSKSFDDTIPRLVSVSVISNNFARLNQAFIASEMRLGPKSDKNTTSFDSLEKF